MDKVKIEDGNGNAVYIRTKKLGYGLKSRMGSEAAQRCSLNGVPRIPDVYMANLVKMKYLIVAWEGPGLPPCKDGQVPPDDMLDDLDEDFGTAITEKINELHPLVDGGDEKKDSTASGESGSKDNEPA